MPPRTGKSTLASIYFPAWHLGHHPTHDVILSSYNLDLPMKFSRKVRDLVKEPRYAALFEATRLHPESQSAEQWETTQGGVFVAAGVGGGLTGRGAHLLIIDDPFKNIEEANSLLIRDQIWEWYWSTAYTRLAPGAGVLLIMTCWHDDDLAGRLQHAERAERFEVVKYPALAEAYEYLVPSTEPASPPLIYRADAPLTEESPHFETARFLRAPGEALHPARYPVDMLANYKANMPPRVWSALYQQNPVPEEGIYFQKEWFKTEPAPPPAYEVNLYQAWDFAIGEGSANDYTVGVTLLQDKNDFLHVLEVVRFRGPSGTIVDEMLAAYARFSHQPTAPLTLGVEDGVLWKALKGLFLSRCAEKRVYPPFEELKTLTNKTDRAKALQGRLQQGRVYFPVNAPWYPVVQNELLRFPAGTHDDIVDSLAHAVNLCVTRRPKAPPPLRELPSWKDRLPELTENGGLTHLAA